MLFGKGDRSAKYRALPMLIALFMFIGRVGPLSIIMFFVGREKPGHLRYPEERVIVG